MLVIDPRSGVKVESQNRRRVWIPKLFSRLAPSLDVDIGVRFLLKCQI